MTDSIQHYSLSEAAKIKGINISEMRHRVKNAGVGRSLGGGHYVLTMAELYSIDISKPIFFEPDHESYFAALNKRANTNDFWYSAALGKEDKVRTAYYKMIGQ